MSTSASAALRLIRFAWKNVLLFGVATTLAVLSGCGGGGSSDAGGGMGGVSVGGGGTATGSSCGSDCGTAMVTVTDANGDFMSYTVDVVSLQLKRANGTTVETLPTKTRVDFAQLVDLSELLTAASVPSGDYVGGTITLDYSNASIAVEVNGQAQIPTIVDSNGQALTTVQLDLQLDNTNHLIVNRGTTSRLALDFNLTTSNNVDLTKTPAQVTVKPVLVASLAPSDSRDLRVRGQLVSVDSATASYVVDLHPFRQDDAKFGQVTVHTTTQTAYEINGQTSSGATGLQALAALPANTPTIAFGSVQLSDKSFTAARVLAGSSVQSTSTDAVVGDVISRTGDTLAIRGATFEQRDGRFGFERGDVSVKVADATKITKEGSTETGLTKQAISVGQRIRVFGQASRDANNQLTVDASSGNVRLEFTPIWGLVKSSNPGSVTLDLKTINEHPVSIFNFAGTNSNPANYAVSTGSLAVTSLANGLPTRFFGFVAPFGAAPPDFNASTLVDYSQAVGQLVVSWLPSGATGPFSLIGNTSLVVDLSNANLGARHFIRIGPQSVDLKSLSGSPQILPDTQHVQVYAIAQGLRINLYASFSEFTTQLASKLDGSTKIYDLTAIGHYDSSANTFTASNVNVVLR